MFSERFMYIQKRPVPTGMILKIKEAKDNNNVFAAVLTDLYKAFDCINRTSHC